MPVRQDLDVPYYHLRLLVVSVVFLISILFPVFSQASKTDVSLLATTIYHEARGENIQGKFAVAMVAINRTENPKYPNTITGVITQPNQFSWYKGRKRNKIYDKREYLVCQNIAKTVISMRKSEAFREFVGQMGVSDVKYFHKRGLKKKPKWAYYKGSPIVIGKHVFYKG
jgi:spore germination cell wall hydrolase CwlJ-like protein